MEEKDIWADVFQRIQTVESIKTDLDVAYDARDQEIVHLYKSGIPAATIARRVGLNHSTIHKILKQQNAKE